MGQQTFTCELCGLELSCWYTIPTAGSKTIARPTSIIHGESRFLATSLYLFYTVVRYSASEHPPKRRSPIRFKVRCARLDRDQSEHSAGILGCTVRCISFVYFFVEHILERVDLIVSSCASIEAYIVSLYFLLVSSHLCHLPGRKAMEMQEMLPRMRVNITHAERSWAKVVGQVSQVPGS